jgi:hypothetical protein
MFPKAKFLPRGNIFTPRTNVRVGSQALAGILLSYCALTQLIKTIYIRRFGQWL